jgi:hypothetical protein
MFIIDGVNRPSVERCAFFFQTDPQTSSPAPTSAIESFTTSPHRVTQATQTASSSGPLQHRA